MKSKFYIKPCSYSASLQFTQLDRPTASTRGLHSKLFRITHKDKISYPFSYSRYDTFNIDLKSKPQWFLDLNSLGKVPTIIVSSEITSCIRINYYFIEKVNNDVIYESIPVCHYLDETFSGRQLNPINPKDKASEAMLLAHFDLVSLHELNFTKYVKAFFPGN